MLALFTDNLSENKQTYQYRQTYTCPSCGAGKAVDGNMSTCMRTDDIGITTTYSKTWWYVDLGGIYNVYNIRIVFKDYPGYSKYVILVVDTFVSFQK